MTTKDYYYKNYRYYYCRHYKKWLIDNGYELIYCDTKQDAIEYIDFLVANGQLTKVSA